MFSSHFPWPSLLATISLSSVSMGLFLLFFVFYSFGLLFQSPHMSEIIQYLSLCVWLISLSLILSRSIHIVTNGKISFFFFFNTSPEDSLTDFRERGREGQRAQEREWEREKEKEKDGKRLMWERNMDWLPLICTQPGPNQTCNLGTGPDLPDG